MGRDERGVRNIGTPHRHFRRCFAGCRTYGEAEPISAEAFTYEAPGISGVWRPVLAVGTASVSGAQTQLSIYAATLLEPNQKTVEVSTDELKQILATGSALVFDARPPMEYAISHIPGARNVGQKPDTPISLYVSDVAEIERQVPDHAAAARAVLQWTVLREEQRLSEDLLAAGYTNVRRYQLGAPTWRALVGTMQIEMDGRAYVLGADRTAWFLDARSADEFAAATLPGARQLPASTKWSPPRTTGDCRWRTTTPASSSSAPTRRRPAKPPTSSPPMPFTT